MSTTRKKFKIVKKSPPRRRELAIEPSTGERIPTIVPVGWKSKQDRIRKAAQEKVEEWGGEERYLEPLIKHAQVNGELSLRDVTQAEMNVRISVTKKQIESIERNNKDRIHLYKEGVFWVAYEISALRLNKQFNKSYRPRKKYIKYLDTSMVSIGFPAGAEIELLRKAKIVRRIKNQIEIEYEGPETTPEEFLKWKSYAPKPEPKPTTDRLAPWKEKMVTIEMLIDDFNVDRSTPLECLRFVYQLKNIVTLNERYIRPTAGV